MIALAVISDVSRDTMQECGGEAVSKFYLIGLFRFVYSVLIVCCKIFYFKHITLKDFDFDKLAFRELIASLIGGMLTIIWIVFGTSALFRKDCYSDSVGSAIMMYLTLFIVILGWIYIFYFEMFINILFALKECCWEKVESSIPTVVSKVYEERNRKFEEKEEEAFKPTGAK